MGALAMITVIRMNKSMLSKRRDKELSFVHTSKEKAEYNLPKATPDVLRKIRERLQSENKDRRVKRFIAMGIAGIALVTLLVYFN